MTQTEDEDIGADELILQYRKVRAKIEAMDAKHAEAVKPYKDALDMLKEELRRILDQAGADSCKTDHGTAYKSIKTSVKTTDKAALVSTILGELGMYLSEAQFTHMVSLVLEHLDLKVNKTTAETYLEAHKENLPGVEISRYIDINVRK